MPPLTVPVGAVELSLVEQDEAPDRQVSQCSERHPELERFPFM